MYDMQNFPRCVFSLPLRAFTCALVLMPPVLFAYCDEALVEEVRRGQASARALLDHSQMDYRVNFQRATEKNGLQNTLAQQLEIRKFKQGDRMRLEVAEQSTGENQYGEEGVRMGGYSDAARKFIVVNENEEAHWSAREGEVSGELSIYRHASPKAMQRNADAHVQSAHGLDLVDYAFGLMTDLSGGPGEAEQSYGRLAGSGIFEAAQYEREGRQVIEVRYLRRGEVLLTALVDPYQGYATTHLTSHAVDPITGAENRFEYQLSLWEVADGVWAPEAFRASEWSSDDGRVIESSATAEVLALVVNPVLDPAIFQWHALGYTGRYVHVHDEDGVGSVMVARGNELHPAPGTDADAEKLVVDERPEESGPADAPMPVEDSVAPSEIVQTPNEPVEERMPETAPQGPSTVVVLLGATLLLAAAGAVAWKMR